MTEFYVISGKTYLTIRGMIKVLAELSTGLDEAPAFPAPWDMVKGGFDLEAAEAEIVRLKEALQLKNNYWHGSWERAQDAALNAMAERDALRNELAELRERQDYIPPAVAEELKAVKADLLLTVREAAAWKQQALSNRRDVEKEHVAAVNAATSADATAAALRGLAAKMEAERDSLREELSLAYAQVDKLRAMESEANHRAKTAEVRLKKMAPLIEASKAYALSPTDSAAEKDALESLEWAALDLFAKEVRKP